MSEGKAVRHEFFAGMTCSGCSNAVTRILGKVPGTTDIVCDVDAKSVFCTSTSSSDVLLAKLQKWANASDKEVRYVGIKSD